MVRLWFWLLLQQALCLSFCGGTGSFSLLFSCNALMTFGIRLTPAEIPRLWPSDGQPPEDSLKLPPWARRTLNLHKSGLLLKVGQKSGFTVLFVAFMWAPASFHTSEGRGACLNSPLLIFWVTCCWRHGSGGPTEASHACCLCAGEDSPAPSQTLYAAGSPGTRVDVDRGGYSVDCYLGSSSSNPRVPFHSGKL